MSIALSRQFLRSFGPAVARQVLFFVTSTAVGLLPRSRYSRCCMPPFDCASQFRRVGSIGAKLRCRGVHARFAFPDRWDERKELDAAVLVLEDQF